MYDCHLQVRKLAEHATESNYTLWSTLAREQAVRRDQHDRLLMQDGPVRVHCRIRPLNSSERSRGMTPSCRLVNGNMVEVRHVVSGRDPRTPSRALVRAPVAGLWCPRRLLALCAASSCRVYCPTAHADNPAKAPTALVRYRLFLQQATIVLFPSTNPSRPLCVLCTRLNRDSLSSCAQTKLFQFDRVYPPECTQQALFAAVQPFAQSAVDGHATAVFAFGPAEAGKTFTMFGLEGHVIAGELTERTSGLAQRCGRELFRLLALEGGDDRCAAC